MYGKCALKEHFVKQKTKNKITTQQKFIYLKKILEM